MKLKNTLLIILVTVCALACAVMLLTNIFDLELNPIKLHQHQLGEFTLKLYGNLSECRIVKVYDKSVRLATLKLNVDKELLSESSLFDPYLTDINGDGHLDLIIPHSKDSNQSIIYSAFTWDNEIRQFIPQTALTKLANIEINTDNNTIASTVNTRIVIAEEQANVPEVFEDETCFTEYKLIENIFVPFRERSLTYYSDTDIYCYSIYDYNEKTKELEYTDEQWITEEEAKNIKLS